MLSVARIEAHNARPFHDYCAIETTTTDLFLFRPPLANAHIVPQTSEVLVYIVSRWDEK